MQATDAYVLSTERGCWTPVRTKEGCWTLARTKGEEGVPKKGARSVPFWGAAENQGSGTRNTLEGIKAHIRTRKINL